MIVIDKLCYQSGLRYVNASEKFVYAILTLIVCIVSRSPFVAAVAFIVNGILTVGKGGIPLFRYVKLLLVPAAFLIVGTAAVMINLSKTPMDAFAFSVGNWYLTGSGESVRRGLEVCAAAFSAVSCLYFLALNTTMTDILGVLKKLRLPPLFIELMMLIYRFIFVLMETASAIMTAQESRLAGRDFRTRVKAFGGMASALFLRALKRANALYDAMESRCYEGTVRVLSEERPAKRREIFLIVIYEILLIIIAIWSIMR